jgi:twitching motility protein PilI
MSTPVSSFNRLEKLLPELFQSSQTTGTSYLRGQLNPQLTVLLPIESVQESLLVNEEQITAVPSMPDYFVGLITSRENVFALIDLPRLLGLTGTMIQSRRIYHTVVIRFFDASITKKEILLGLVFDRIQGITRMDLAQIEPVSSNIPESIKAYLCGALTDKEQTLPVLDLPNIINKTMQT